MRVKSQVSYGAVQNCCLCSDNALARCGTVRAGLYSFGRFDIPYPADTEAIPLLRCQLCGLVFKGLVPRQSDVLRLLADSGARIWRSGGRVHTSVRDLILTHVSEPRRFDSLDVGSSDGAVLRLFPGIPGRRSALDVVRNNRCESVVKGEYIESFLDKPVHWSEEPYDAVTAFDVLEHLHAPRAAVDNLARFVKPGGILVIQTGDADYPARSGVSWDTWWYVNLFEHNVFWCRDALRRAFEERGFEETYWVSEQQKDRAATPVVKKLGIAALRFAGRASVAARLLLPVLGRDVRLLADPFARDHLTMIFRKAS